MPYRHPIVHPFPSNPWSDELGLGQARHASTPDGSYRPPAVRERGRNLGKGSRDLSDEALYLFRMFGIRHAATPTRYWVEVSRRGLAPRIQARLGSKILTPIMVHLHRMDLVLHDKPGASAEVESVKTNIWLAGELGIQVVEYTSTPLRGSQGNPRTTGPDGIGLRDYGDVRTRDLPLCRTLESTRGISCGSALSSSCAKSFRSPSGPPCVERCTPMVRPCRRSAARPSRFAPSRTRSAWSRSRTARRTASCSTRE